jgi:hypothetical protein
VAQVGDLEPDAGSAALGALEAEIVRGNLRDRRRPPDLRRELREPAVLRVTDERLPVLVVEDDPWGHHGRRLVLRLVPTTTKVPIV